MIQPVHHSITQRISRSALFGVTVILCVLVGCSTIGVDRQSARPATQTAFEQALISYAVGDLDAAQTESLQALDKNPLDVRATELLRAILREKGSISELERVQAVELPEFSPSSPEDLVSVILGRSPQVREAVFRVIEARAELREANVDVGPEISILTRFYPLGILGRISQSLYGGWWERKAKMSAAEASILEALAYYGRVTESVNQQALTAYIDAIAATKIIALLKTERERLQLQRKIAVTQVEYGRKLPREPLVVNREIAANVQATSAANQQLATAKAVLNTLMNRHATSTIELNALGIVWRPQSSIDDSITTAYMNRFDIDEMQAKLKTAEARKKLETATDPDIDFYASHGSSDVRNESSFLKGFSVGAITRFPLAILPLKKARIDQHDAVIRQLELQEEQVRNDIAVEVVETYHTWHTTRSDLDEQQQLLALASEDQRVANARSTAEVENDPFALSRAEINFLRAQRAVLEKNYEVQRALIALSSTMGTAARDIQFLVAQTAADEIPQTSKILIGDGRAIWVWRSEFIDEPEDAQFLTDLLLARGIRSVFLYVRQSDLVERGEQLGDFIELAYAKDIEVHALNGEHQWLLNDDGRTKAIGYANRIVRFNAQNSIQRQFAAVHFDIEPHALKRWDFEDQREALLFSYIDLLDGLRPVRESLSVVVDIPVWYLDRTIDGVRLIDAVKPRTDGVVYMAYGMDPDRRTRFQNLLSTHAGSHKFWFGMSADRRHICLAPSAEEFERDVRELERALNVNTEFQGVAIHDIDRYRDLLLGVRKYADTVNKQQCLHARAAGRENG